MINLKLSSIWTLRAVKFNVCCCSVVDLMAVFHLPTVVTRRSGWSCRNMNCLWSEVISHSTSSRLITVSASCRTCRGLQQTGGSPQSKNLLRHNTESKWLKHRLIHFTRGKTNKRRVKNLRKLCWIYDLYLITGRRTRSKCEHSTTTFLEGSGQETSHTGRDATVFWALLS